MDFFVCKIDKNSPIEKLYAVCVLHTSECTHTGRSTDIFIMAHSANKRYLNKSVACEKIGQFSLYKNVYDIADINQTFLLVT